MFTLAIDTGNDAFHPDAGPEVARILEELAKKLREEGPLELSNLRDLNGNTVGTVRYTGHAL